MATEKVLDEKVLEKELEQKCKRDERETLRHLTKECKQVEIKIPISELNPDLKSTQVVFNGVVFEIEFGKKITVPEPIVEILERANYL